LTGGISAVVGAYVLTFGGKQVLQGDMSLGSLVAFLSYVGYVFGPIRTISDVTSRLQVSVVCLERIFQIFDEATEHPSQAPAEAEPIAIGDIRFRDVSFRYRNQNGNHALSHVSLDIPRGERVAFVGRSGSGKTTAAMLLLRMFTGFSGAITLDGRPIESIPVKNLRRAVALVPQDISLFDGSIVENLRLGREDISEDAIMQACRMANIDRFVVRQDRGTATDVGRDGTRLSGGEKQRMAIARALVRKPQLLIFDEATSDLDAESEEIITRTVRGLSADCSALIIAHRLSTVRDVDTIYVFDEGRVVGSGSHEELLRDCDLYRDLYQKQFGAREALAV
jgi:ABC-type multidrug transport system fused ATPase/permease subunit